MADLKCMTCGLIAAQHEAGPGRHTFVSPAWMTEPEHRAELLGELRSLVANMEQGGISYPNAVGRLAELVARERMWWTEAGEFEAVIARAEAEVSA